MAKPKVSKEALLAERDSTMDHCAKVNDILQCVSNQLRVRGRNHDRSKFTDEELPYFAHATDLKKLPYGSKGYGDQIAVGSGIRPALDHHYKNNRHHPEHHGEDGIQGMNMVDVLEMLCDWLAAGLRHGPDHNIFHSINVNRMRFRIHHGLARIMWNTACDVFGEEPDEGYEMCIIKACPHCGVWQDPQHKACQECDSKDLYVV